MGVCVCVRARACVCVSARGRSWGWPFPGVWYRDYFLWILHVKDTLNDKWFAFLDGSSQFSILIRKCKCEHGCEDCCKKSVHNKVPVFVNDLFLV